MAVLRLENGKTYTHLPDIAQQLAPLKVQLDRWPVGADPALSALLAQECLDEVEKEQVLQALDHYFVELQQTRDYQDRDLIVLFPAMPNLDGLLAKFNRPHTHADDEVRCVIDGEGIFGFITPEQGQMELTLQAQEYINVPAGTEHWFYLSPTCRIKAIRYFTGTGGWVPEYTDSIIRMQPVAA